jgi:hypothetical protein
VLDDTTACWWYEQDGRQAGPVTAAAIARLVAEGRLGPAHRVWRDGMSTWEPLASVAELAPALQTARPPPLSPPPSFDRPHAPHGRHAPFGAGWGAAAPGAAFEEISPTAVILLSVVTLGIYGIVKFHQTGRGYEALAGRSSTFGRDFWIGVALGAASAVMFHTPFVWGPLSVASLVFQVLALGEALQLRDEAVGRAPVQPALTGAGTHKVLYVAGVILFPFVVGTILLVVQCWRWFTDWNAVGAALAQGGGPAATVPVQGQTSTR